MYHFRGDWIWYESFEYYFRVQLKRTGNQELWSLSQLYCQILIGSFSVVFFFKEWYGVETRSWFLLKKNMHNKVFEFHSTGAPTQVEDGNVRLNTRFLEHRSVASPVTNQKKVTHPEALIPNVASCFWGPVMTILLGLLFGPCLFRLWEEPKVSN